MANSDSRLKAQCKTGLGWVCGISHIRRSSAINLPGTGAAQLWPFFTPDWRRFAKPFLEPGIKRISVANFLRATSCIKAVSSGSFGAAGVLKGRSEAYLEIVEIALLVKMPLKVSHYSVSAFEASPCLYPLAT